MRGEVDMECREMYSWKGTQVQEMIKDGRNYVSVLTREEREKLIIFKKGLIFNRED